MGGFNLEFWSQLASIVQSLLQSLAIIVGGIWVVNRYFGYAENRANPKLSISAVFLGRQRGEWVVEVQCSVENRGKVPYKIHKLELQIKTIDASDGLASSLERRGNLLMPNDYSESSLLASDFVSTVDPGVKTDFVQLCVIPAGSAFANFFVSLEALGPGMHEYYVEKNVSVPSNSISDQLGRG